MKHTKIIEKQLFENRNSSDIFDREIIAGVLRILNRKVVYQQIWDDQKGEVEQITIPFFYNFGGNNPNSEKFIQDNYLFFGEEECNEIGLKKIDGNFDVYPRGEITLSSSSISASNITNRFVLGRFQKREDDEIRSYVSNLYSIPLDYQFNVEVRCMTMTEMFKIEQAFREYFYKNKTFHFNYKGLIVPARIGFPETDSRNSSEQYTMGSTDQKQYLTTSFTIGVESYQPVFDPTTEIPAESQIQGFGLGVGTEGKQAREGERWIKPISDLSDSILLSGTSVMIDWTYSFQYSDLLNVSISYIDQKTNDEVIVEKQIKNSNFYVWDIPEDLGTMQHIDIIVQNTEDARIIEQPEIKIAPNIKTKVVSQDNVKVLKKGLIISEKSQIDATLSYLNNKNKIEDVPIKINLKNGMVDEEKPLEFKSFVYKNALNPLKIDLKVSDSYHSETNFIMNNITIL